MKQFGLRYLYKHLGKALKEIPFEITNHNRVIAVVTESGDLIRRFVDGREEIFDSITNTWKENEPQKLN